MFLQARPKGKVWEASALEPQILARKECLPLGVVIYTISSQHKLCNSPWFSGMMSVNPRVVVVFNSHSIAAKFRTCVKDNTKKHQDHWTKACRQMFRVFPRFACTLLLSFFIYVVHVYLCSHTSTRDIFHFEFVLYKQSCSKNFKRVTHQQQVTYT